LPKAIIYRDQDITLDVMMKIEHVVTLIAEAEHVSFDKALLLFTVTRTYRSLMNTESLMWSESAEFLLDEFLRERQMPQCECRKDGCSKAE